MGLEIHEIVMDLEKAFLIEIPQGINFTGYVYELEKIVLDLYSAKSLENLLDALPENEIGGYLPADKYLDIWESNHALPRPLGLFNGPKRIRREKVSARITSALKYKDDECAIRQEIARIIKSVSGSNKAVTSDMHLVKDLGCG